MKSYRKRDFPLMKIRRFLEPGPIVLVSSAWKGKANIMTMGWHMMLGFSPALFGCYIWDGKAKEFAKQLGQLTLRQGEIEEKLDLTKNQAPSQAEAEPAENEVEKNSEAQDVQEATKRRVRMNV